MPSAPPRPCPGKGGRCGRLVKGGGLCARCRQERQQRQDEERPSAAARGYGGRWPAYARSWLQQYPWCGQRQDGRMHAQHSVCVQLGQRVRATCVDHIRSIADGGSVFDPANHQSLCTSCNVRKG